MHFSEKLVHPAAIFKPESDFGVKKLIADFIQLMKIRCIPKNFREFRCRNKYFLELGIVELVVRRKVMIYPAQTKHKKPEFDSVHIFSRLNFFHAELWRYEESQILNSYCSSTAF